MTVETPQPREGDRVRVTPKPFEGELKCDGTQGRLIQVRDDAGRLNAFGPDYATVEVLERAQDDAKLAPGTYELTKRVHVGEDGLARFVDMPDGPLAEYVAGFWHKTRTWVRKVEPARPSVRVPNEPHGPSADAVAYMARLIKSGKPVEAVGVAHDQGMEWADARRYVESMPEYETYLNHHGEKAEPRVFMSWGPEPPADVRVLEWLDATDGRRYLKRFESAWLWVDGPNDRDPGGVGEWPPFHPGRYREVS